MTVGLTVSVEQILIMFENGMLYLDLRGRRRLYTEEIHNLNASLNIIMVIKSRRIRWLGHVACMGEMRGVYKILVEKPARKGLLRRFKCRWEDNIRMYLRKIVWKGVEWIHLAQHSYWWQAVMNSSEPSGSIKTGNLLTPE
jgi:hypothetical protein